MSQQIAKTIEYNGYIIKIAYDQQPENPRNYSNLGTMCCFHKKYSLGDKHELKQEDFRCWDEIFEYLQSNEAVVLPLYLYDHSGLSIATTPFSCPWDSGAVGYIYASADDILKSFQKHEITMNLLKEAERVLQAEVKNYNQYLQGHCYGFIIEDNQGHIDSCFGFFGDLDYCECEAKAVIDLLVKLKMEQVRNNANYGDGI